MARLSNYALSVSVTQLLRRLTAHGLDRDRKLAETLIRDLDSRLCPHPPQQVGGCYCDNDTKTCRALGHDVAYNERRHRRGQ